MPKHNRKPTIRESEKEANDFQGNESKEKAISSRRPYDPFYKNCTFDMATFQQQLARTYHPDTIAHLAITRKSASNGDGHLPQPIIRESNGTQLAVEALLRGKDRQIITLDKLLPEPNPSTIPIIPETDQSSTDFVPPFRRGGWKIVEL